MNLPRYCIDLTPKSEFRLQLSDCDAVGGKVTLIGGLSGGATELNPGLIFARRANVQGISVDSTQMFEAMNRAIEFNSLKPVIDRVFAFNDVQAACRRMATGAHFGKHFGKTVIRVT